MPRKGQKSETKASVPPTKSTRLSRAKNERMYFMGRAAEAEGAAAAFIVSGQSGKIWTVTIPREKSRSGKGHILKIPEEQLQCVEDGGDLDVSLLHEVLDKVPGEVDNKYTAPAALKARLKAIAGDFESGGEIPKVEPRLPEEGESCPICYEDLLDGTALVHCNYGCGKPVHTECFSRYSDAQKGRYERDEVSDNKLKCVTCRTDWVMQATNVIGKRGMLIGRRAINLAEEMPDEFVLPRSRSRAGSSSKASKSKSKASKSKAAGSSSKRGASSSKAEGGVREGRVTRKRTKGEPSGRTARSETKARRSARLAGEAPVENASANASASSKKSTKVAKGKISKGKDARGRKGGQGSKSSSKRTRSSTRTAPA